MNSDFIYRIVDLTKDYVNEHNLSSIYDETVFDIIKDSYFIRDQIGELIPASSGIPSLAKKEASGVYGEFRRNNLPDEFMLLFILDYALEATKWGSVCVDDYFRDILIIIDLLDYIERWGIF